MISTAGTVTLENLVFRNCRNTASEGGAVMVEKNILSVKNCVFENNYALAGAGIATVTKMVSITDIDGCTFKDNTVKNNGGALNIMNSNVLFLSNSTFNEWLDFSITMNTDINVASLTQVSLGEETLDLAPGTITFDPAYDWQPIDKFNFYCYTGIDEESTSFQGGQTAADSSEAGIYLARLVIRDPALPEPAAALLAAAALALFLRKR